MVLVISGATAAVLTLGAFALVKGDASASTAQTAHTAPKSSHTAPKSSHTAPKATRPLRDEPRAEPTRTDRGKTRAPEPSPTRTKTPKRKPDTESGHMPKPEAKKKRNKAVESGSCEASYYWQGQMTASGEKFDPSELTAAHKTLPMGSKVRVTNKNNGRSVTVRINDRGPFVSGRCLDLSKAAMKKVRGTGSGVIPVRYEVLSRG
ncbi:septal ring lytic transglycosylase RlpA family protein [Actinomadura sp. KC345]|uniref:septal ring lytic transglycosylase RlpA family protein n=1 Tax=Actinomadura sp. KC345 TaxID=2530371 RepID=UPI00105242A5|nr:septal ring lytic transglycosylase RlpA family protein [Actinomadura sp. KC345]TDC47167.1 septal ring lytic transglycosylase RlpA family protein [Actinomadura sp. KC345]